MNNTRKHGARWAVLLASVALIVALGACDPGVYVLTAPVEYVSVALLAGDRGTLHTAAGLYYTIGNTSDATIRELEIGFDLYGADGEPYPRRGGNSFATSFSCLIGPGGAAAFCTSLDGIVGGVPVDLQVSRFRVRAAHFADGTSWHNPGAHVYREESLR